MRFLSVEAQIFFFVCLRKLLKSWLNFVYVHIYLTWILMQEYIRKINLKDYFLFLFLLSNNKPSKNTVSSGNRTQQSKTDFPGQHSDHWVIETHSPHVFFDRNCEWPVKLGQHSLLDVKRHYWCFEPALASRNI